MQIAAPPCVGCNFRQLPLLGGPFLICNIRNKESKPDASTQGIEERAVLVLEEEPEWGISLKGLLAERFPRERGGGGQGSQLGAWPPLGAASGGFPMGSPQLNLPQSILSERGAGVLAEDNGVTILGAVAADAH